MLFAGHALQQHPGGYLRVPGQGVGGDLVRRQGPDLQAAGEGGVVTPERRQCASSPLGTATPPAQPTPHHPPGHQEVGRHYTNYTNRMKLGCIVKLCVPYD